MILARGGGCYEDLGTSCRNLGKQGERLQLCVSGVNSSLSWFLSDGYIDHFNLCDGPRVKGYRWKLNLFGLPGRFTFRNRTVSNTVVDIRNDLVLSCSVHA